MPTLDELQRNRWLAPIAHRLGHSELWRFTRRSVPRGVALGLFAGFIVPLGQIFLAAFLALPVRANLPIAIIVTFITNPFTLPFWLVVANKVGRFALQNAGVGAAVSLHGNWWSEFGWFVYTAGVTAFGFIVLALVSTVIGYLAASLGWRVLVARRWTRRSAHRVMVHPAE